MIAVLLKVIKQPAAVLKLKSGVYTVKKWHARNFSSELIHILLLKIQKVSHIS
jgi:hypothetical protein